MSHRWPNPRNLIDCDGEITVSCRASVGRVAASQSPFTSPVPTRASHSPARCAAVADLHGDRPLEQFEQPERLRGLGEDRGASKGRQVEIRELELHLRGTNSPFPLGFRDRVLRFFKIHPPSEFPGNPIFARKPRYRAPFR